MVGESLALAFTRCIAKTGGFSVMQFKKDQANAKNDLQTLPLPEVEMKLDSSPDGLSQAEAQKWLAHYGPNEIEEKTTNPFLKFLSYFWGPIPWMIEAALVLSAINRHWPDFIIILVLLLANSVVGFLEEHQAGNRVGRGARGQREGGVPDPSRSRQCLRTAGTLATRGRGSTQADRRCPPRCRSP